MSSLSHDELISAYLDGELSGDELASAEKLIAENAESRQLLDELRSLRSGIESLPRHRLDEDFAGRVLDRAERTMVAGGISPAAATSPAAPVAMAAQARDVASSKEPLPEFDGRDRIVRMIAWPAIAVAAAILIMFVMQPGGDDLAPEVAQHEPAELGDDGRNAGEAGAVDRGAEGLAVSDDRLRREGIAGRELASDSAEEFRLDVPGGAGLPRGASVPLPADAPAPRSIAAADREPIVPSSAPADGHGDHGYAAPAPSAIATAEPQTTDPQPAAAERRKDKGLDTLVAAAEIVTATATAEGDDGDELAALGRKYELLVTVQNPAQRRGRPGRALGKVQDLLEEDDRAERDEAETQSREGASAAADDDGSPTLPGTGKQSSRSRAVARPFSSDRDDADRHAQRSDAEGLANKAELAQRVYVLEGARSQVEAALAELTAEATRFGLATVRRGSPPPKAQAGQRAASAGEDAQVRVVIVVAGAADGLVDASPPAATEKPAADARAVPQAAEVEASEETGEGSSDR
ncbi:MAG: hypothetical protein DWQ35_21905 [Planctomycetota bacterium]|nr:MAG: hypothetical protein DWQ35_21905 [Planctomycetota bacterium]REK23834.1 MAG: hypothetical protein DWQ42_14265 [Planctomycetota bacterium]REK40596.1 MAG: hypothetical protein DWQ46_15920 [Planctomycetota bacterium]